MSYPLKLIAKNAGVNGSVVIEKVCAQFLSCIAVLQLMLNKILTFHVQVLANNNFRYGYNAATGKYEDLMAAGIIDPTKVCLCRTNIIVCHFIHLFI